MTNDHLSLSPETLQLADSTSATASRIRAQSSRGHIPASDLARFLIHAETLRDEADQLAWAIRRMGAEQA